MQKEFILEIHDANPIVDVASEYISLKKSGKTYSCRCPFHSEKTPSCYFFPDTQSFYCFGCGTGGDVISFVEKIENIGFNEACEKLAKRAGLTIPENDEYKKTAALKERIFDINRAAANFYYSNLLRGKDRRGLNYFIQRKMNAATIKKYGLGFAPNEWTALHDHLLHLGFSDFEMLKSDVCRRSKNGGLIDTFRNRVMFPITDVRGRVIAFGGRVLDDSKPKYLNTSDTPVFDKGRNCFSIEFATRSSAQLLILCEGYMDVIAMNQAGFEGAVATLGTSMTPAQARLLRSYTENVIIAYDSDGPGQRATMRAINLLSEVGVRTYILKMEGAKDPDEFIKKFGSDRFRLLLQKTFSKSNDALSFEFENCFKGLDYENDPTDATKALNNCVDILAKITNYPLRLNWTSKIARQLKIDQNNITRIVDSKIKKMKRQESNQQWANEQRKLNASAAKNTKEYKAEQEILNILMHGSAFDEYIIDSIDESMFTDQTDAKIFFEIKKIIKSKKDFSLSSLSEILSQDEMNTASRIINSKSVFRQNEEEIQALIDIIKKGYEKRSFDMKNSLNDEDLIKFAQSHK